MIYLPISFHSHSHAFAYGRNQETQKPISNSAQTTIAGKGSKFEKTVIIDGKVYEYIVKHEMTDEEIKRYYDQVNESGVSLSFFFSPKNNLYIYIYTTI